MGGKGISPVYSVHVDATGTLLATGGQDQKVRIWKITSAIDTANNDTSAMDTENNTRSTTESNLRTENNNNSLATDKEKYNTQDKIHSQKDSSKTSSDTLNIGRNCETLSSHTGAVMCVRFSQSGLLASGSDDMRIVIWKPTEIGDYRAINVLVGHSSDVSDLAWSPDTQFLASAALDASVIIWDANSFERLRTLPHLAFVKGLSFYNTQVSAGIRHHNI